MWGLSISKNVVLRMWNFIHSSVFNLCLIATGATYREQQPGPQLQMSRKTNVRLTCWKFNRLCMWSTLIWTAEQRPGIKNRTFLLWSMSANITIDHQVHRFMHNRQPTLITKWMVVGFIWICLIGTSAFPDVKMCNYTSYKVIF